MSKKTSGIVAELRQAIRQAERRGVIRAKIAKTTGVSEAALSRFVAGSVPGLDTAERIAKAIGRPLVLSKKTCVDAR